MTYAKPHFGDCRAEQAGDPRNGAADVRFSETDDEAAVEFAFRGRRVRIAVPLPAFDLSLHSPSGRRRVVRIGAAQAEYEDQKRRRWKALAILIRAKLYAVVAQARTFEQEFEGDVIGQVPASDLPAGDLPDAARNAGDGAPGTADADDTGGADTGGDLDNED